MYINQIGPEKAITFGKIHNEYNIDEIKARKVIRESMEKQWDDSFVNKFNTNAMLKTDINTRFQNFFTKEFNLKTGIIKKFRINCKNQFLSELLNN